MKPLALILLFFAVTAVAGLEAANLSLPDRDLSETVAGASESMWGFLAWLEQIINDLMTFLGDLLRHLQLGTEYIQRLMEVMDSGRDLVNKTVEHAAPPR